MDAIIGIDLGTTHMKTCLFDTNGRVIQMEKQETPRDSDEYGSVYLPERIWKVVCSQLAEVLKSREICVLGICLTGMAEAGLIVDRKTGKEKTSILPWFDERTKALSDRMDEEREGEIFSRTGLRKSFKYGIYKFLWLLEQTEMDKKDAVWLSMCDYIAWKLTGRFVTEPGLAARTYVYDIKENCWDGKRIREYGLDVSNFPEVVSSGSVAGIYRSPDGRGFNVAICGHDHICAAFALLWNNPKGICDSAGTSETYIGRLSPDTASARFGKDPPEISMESGLLYGPFGGEGYFFMANIPSSGHSVEWFRKKLQLSGLSFEQMNGGLQKLEKQPSGLLYFPYLTGMGSPLYNPIMKGCMLGICEEMDGWKILKGILEGIQYQAAWLMEILKRAHGIEGDKILCAGGSVRNSVMMQLKADILNKKVFASEMPEATLYGAAAMFLRQNGGADAVDAFLSMFLENGDTYIPDGERSGQYQCIWKEQYLPMIDILVHFFK